MSNHNNKGEVEHSFPHKLLIKEGYIGVIHHPSDRLIIIYALGTRIEVGEFAIEKGTFSETYDFSDLKQIELAYRFKESLLRNELPYSPKRTNGEIIEQLTERAKSLLSLVDKLNFRP